METSVGYLRFKHCDDVTRAGGVSFVLFKTHSIEQSKVQRFAHLL